jgi:hypothetical protein
MSKYRLEHPLDDTDPIVMPGVNPERSCIYIFFIDGLGCYVGKSDGKKPTRRWQKTYSKNVQDKMDGKPWHGDPSMSFRRIHDALCKAVKERQRIVLVIYENHTGKALTDREAELIRAIGTLNGHRSKQTKRTIGPDVIKAVSTAKDIVEITSRVVKKTNNLTGSERRKAVVQPESSHASSWLNLHIEAIKDAPNPFLRNSKRWNRHKLLLKLRKRITIREYNGLLVADGLPRSTKKYIGEAIKHRCIRVFDENGLALNKNGFSEF